MPLAQVVAAPASPKPVARPAPPAPAVPTGALPWLIAGAFFAVYAALSVQRHLLVLTGGYDLGIFEQAVRAWAHFQAPVVALKGPDYNLLGDHFHPILAVLAPVYRIFPSPITLLVAQSALVALAIVPITRWAQRARGKRVALAVGVGMGLSWGFAELVHFDFHEICFAIPMVAFALEAVGRGRWRAAAAWAVPMLLVKEDLGLTVAMLGAYIVWKGPRRLGIALAVVGVLGTALEMLVVIPALNPSGGFSYLIQVDPAGAPGAPALGIFPSFAGGWSSWWPPTRLETVVMLAAPTAFLALRSPLAALALPTLGWRFLSHNHNYWGTSYHYNGILIPIAFAAMVDVLARDRVRYSGVRLRVLMGLGLAVTAVTVCTHPLYELADPGAWHSNPHSRAARALAREIPDGVSVAASNRIGAQLTNRTTVSMACPYLPPPQAVQWMVIDREDGGTDLTKCPSGLDSLVRDAANSGYTVVEVRDGITLLRWNG